MLTVEKAEIIEGTPDLAYIPPRSRRRMDSLMRLCVEGVHRLLPLDPEARIYLVAADADRETQFAHDRQYIVDEQVHPATFAVATANAPIAQATVLFHLHQSHQALFTAEGKLSDGLRAAAAPLLSGSCPEADIIIARAKTPEAYLSLSPARSEKAIALKIVRDGAGREFRPEDWIV